MEPCIPYIVQLPSRFFSTRLYSASPWKSFRNFNSIVYYHENNWEVRILSFMFPYHWWNITPFKPLTNKKSSTEWPSIQILSNHFDHHYIGIPQQDRWGYYQVSQFFWRPCLLLEFLKRFLDSVYKKEERRIVWQEFLVESIRDLGNVILGMTSHHIMGYTMCLFALWAMTYVIEIFWIFKFTHFPILFIFLLLSSLP